jgi:aminocarboxymuconate-semialdehyde decarboxylase
LSRIHVDCICHGDSQLALAEQTFGESNVLFGSDWPFPMGLIEPHNQMSEVDTNRKARIFGANAERIFKLISREDLL